MMKISTSSPCQEQIWDQLSSSTDHLVPWSVIEQEQGNIQYLFKEHVRKVGNKTEILSHIISQQRWVLGKKVIL